MSPFFRKSYGRDAYVLRGIGNRWGPVLQVRASGQVGAPGEASDPVPEAAGEDSAPPPA